MSSLQPRPLYLVPADLYQYLTSLSIAIPFYVMKRLIAVNDCIHQRLNGGLPDFRIFDYSSRNDSLIPAKAGPHWRQLTICAYYKITMYNPSVAGNIAFSGLWHIINQP
jgi:hypothetical protein